MSHDNFLLMRATFLANQPHPHAGQAGLRHPSGGKPAKKAAKRKHYFEGHPQFVQHMLDCMDKDIPSFGALSMLCLLCTMCRPRVLLACSQLQAHGAAAVAAHLIPCACLCCAAAALLCLQLG